MKIKNVLKRALSLALAVLMTLSAIPAITTEVWAISGTVANGRLTLSGGSNWTRGSDTAFSGSVTGAFISANSTEIKITNSTSESGTFYYDYKFTGADNGDYLKIGSTTLGSGKKTVSGSSYATIGSGSAVTFTLNAGAGGFGNKAKAEITNIRFVLDSEKITATFAAPQSKYGEYVGGTYSIEGVAIPTDAATKAVAKATNENFSALATCNSGYNFHGWYSTKDGYIGSNLQLTVSANSVTNGATIYPVFVPQNDTYPRFTVSNQEYFDLNRANEFVLAKGGSTIVLTANGTLPAGNYTIPSGKTLLIPFDSANTLYTDSPAFVDYTNAYPQGAYKTLTMASGANIVVNGAMSVSAKYYSTHGGTVTGGSVAGYYGHVVMNSGSSITVNGSLYAWGYITGNGTVTAKNGASVYEYIQVTDFRGGDVTSDMATAYEKIFPFSQYYIQNIEATTRYEYGSKMYVTTTMHISLFDLTKTIQFIGKDTEEALFVITENGGVVTKKYNPSTDRMDLSVDGNVSLKKLLIDIGSYASWAGLPETIDSSKYVLPINSGYTIDVLGGTITITEDIAILPGTMINVADGANLVVSKNVYIYDLDEWDLFVFKSSYPTLVTGGNYKVNPVVYSPSTNVHRTASDLTDAIINVNGTVTINGAVYTTSSGASIISEGKSGKIIWNVSAPADGVTYQLLGNNTTTQTNTNGVQTTGYKSIAVTSAKLLNGDDTFTLTKDTTATADAPATYIYDALTNKWVLAKDVTVSYELNGGSGTANTTSITKDEVIARTGKNVNDGTNLTAPEGYEFDSWNTKSDGTGTEFAAGGTIVTAENVILYAQWKPISYTIEFNANGGEGSTAKVANVNYDANATLTPNGFTRKGYKFLGWAKSATGEKVYDDKESVKNLTTTDNETVTLYAVWQINQYTITFDTDGGNEIEAIKQDYGTAVTTPANPTKTGYTFAGWDTTIPATMPANDVTITAKWKINQYTITFDTDGGSDVAAITQDYGTAVTAPANPTKTGYTFAGWDVEIPATMPAENMTITAQWTVNQYTITFDTDGGSEVAPITQDYGTAVTAPANPTKEGHTFAGWDTAVPATMPAGDMVITATWTINQCTITFNTDGGSAIDSITANYGTAVTAPANPTKEGHTFAGWDTAVPATMPAENVTITATWTINQYTITFNTDGGSAIDSITANYGTAIAPIADPTKTGYTFAGWDVEIPATMPAYDVTYTAKWNVRSYTVKFMNGDELHYYNQPEYGSVIEVPTYLTKAGYTLSWTAINADTGESISNPTKVPAYNVTFTAVWTPNNYTIAFDEAGGSAVEDIVAGYETDISDKTLPSTSKTGYKFDGWYDENNDKVESLPETMPLDGITLTAKWTINQYTITCDFDDGTATHTTSYTIESEAITLTEPTKTGYTFAGWTGTDLTEATKNVTIAKGSIGNREYTANWTINQYTITFDTDGGSTVDSITQDYGTAVTAPANPTKEGHTFAGWSVDGITAVEFPETMPAGGLSLKALWTVKQFTITFDTDGGSEVAPITQDYGTAVTAPANPTKTGYTFAGWDTEVPATMPAENMTITAQWTVNQYAITFNTDGGSDVAAITQDYGTAVTAPANPTKTGYTFAGWDVEIPATMPAENMTITAQWTVNRYTITFDTDGGSEVAPITQNYGTAVTAPANPTKTGYTFAGWTFDGSAAELPEKMPAENRTYVATWTANTDTAYTVKHWQENLKANGSVYDEVNYTLTDADERTGTTADEVTPAVKPYAGFTAPATQTVEIAADGSTVVNYYYTRNTYQIKFMNGTDEVSSVKIQYGETIIVPTHLTKEGYTLIGWTDGTNDYEVGDEYTIVCDATLTAVWDANEYTITFVDTGDVAYDTITKDCGEAVGSVADPVKTGYTFAGWDTTIPTTMPAEDMTITAKWTINQYTVTWNVDGDKTTETYAYGASITAPADPTKVGYTFKGWSPVVADTMPAENLAYTATWEVNKYTVTWVNGTTTMMTTTQDFGLVIAQPANPTKTGHTFLGWAFSADATVADYPVGAVTVDANIVNNANSNNEVALYAVFSTNSYTATWNVDGVETEETYKFDDHITVLQNPEKTGYTFNGWATTNTDTGASVGLPTRMPAYNVTFTATWEINEYEITWLVDSNTYNEKTYNHGAIIVAPADPTKESTVGTVFTFSHWDGFTEGMTATEPKTFVAVFTETVRQYTISFNADGGSAVESVTDDYNKVIVLPNVSSSSKTGYTLVGWTDGTKTYNVGGEYTIVGDATLTAVWDANEYTITFANTGDTTIDAIKQDYGTDVTAPANPTKTGYTFAGWDTTIPTTMPAEDMTITAKWTINQYTITFNTDGGSAVDPVKKDYGAAVTTPADPTKTGYTFAGWYIDDNRVDFAVYTVPANNVTATARWTVNNYTVTWKTDGAEDDVDTYAYGASIIAPANPAKEGFNFGGWTRTEGSGEIYHIATMPAEDITLYPIWTSGYVATFISDGTAVTDYSKAYTTGDTIDKPTLTKEGYTFDGWTVTNTNTDERITPEPEVMPDYNITFTAKWTPISYTIAFNANGGEGLTAKVANVNYDANATLTPNGFTREGYTFIGWATSATGEKVYNDEASVKNLTATVNETVTLYAVWQINQYTITFNTDGGSTVDSITADYGTAIGEISEPTKTGYTFAGWDKEIPATMPAEDMTITAKWTINKYTIEFNTDGGTEMADIKLDYGTAVTAPADPTKTGYTFAGWIITKTGTGEVITAPETIPAYNVTYTAQWTINQYTITFANTGDTTIAPITLDYGTAVTAPADPTKTGYTFAGWDKEIPTTMPAEDMTITASWTANEYDLVWVYDNGEENNTVKVAYGAEIAEPNAPAKTGHTFAGWYDGDTKVTFPMTMPLNGITLTAKWTINTYTVKWVNANGGVIETDENVPYGTAPTFNGSTPTKAPDAQYTYTFNKWVNAETEADMANVSGNVTYKPQFSTTTNTYTVTWIDGNGNVFFKQENVPYGTVITLPEGTPVKDATVDKVFAFASWGGFTSGMTVDGNEEFTAQFTESARLYTITWVDGDGETLNTESVAYGEMPEYTGETPAKTATDKYTYTFNGSWNSAITTVTGDATYVAQFDAVVNEYTISWDTDGDGDIDDTTSVAYDEMPAHADGAKAPTAEYTYVFAGWTPAITTVTGNATYKATFTDIPNEYSVIFDVNGGNAVDSIEVAYGSIIDLSAISATKEGYTFAGWDNVPSTMPANDVTVVAKWSANKYTVKLDANGGVGEEMSSLEKTYDVSLGLTENTYTREGYKFLGWSADKNAMTATYADESILDVDLASENGATVTLYAVWEIQQYTITFVNTGDITYEAITADYGTAIAPIATPTKTGYTFAGWDTEVPTTMPAENVTITAQWTINSYDIKWVDGLGNTIKTETLEYNASTSAVIAPTATREGYTFAGWDREVPAIMPADDVTITATWTINQYTITWKVEDAEDDIDTYDYGTPIIAPADPTRTGYTFAGWDKEVPATMPAEDMTITAQWTVNAYTISFNTNGGSAVADITKNYGEEIGTVTVPTKTGYTFAGWTFDGSAAELPEKIPAENRTYVATWIANTDTKYTVVHWFQKLGVYATDKNETNFASEVSETLSGTTGAKILAQGTFDGFSAMSDSKNYYIAADGSTVVNYYYTRNTYQIKFMNGDNQVQSGYVQYGAVPTFSGSIPTKAESVSTVYTFAGWEDENGNLLTDSTVVTGATVYHAVFTESARKYTITWKNEDGSVIYSENVAYGTLRTYGGATPTKPSTAKYTYTHSGWTPEVVAVTGNATYTATYIATINKYTITWMNEGTLIYSESVEYGTVPSYDIDAYGTPAKETTAQYTYSFRGWDKTINAVTGDATYTAQYNSTVNAYTVTWVDEDGTVLETDTNVLYGTRPEFNKNNPTKEATAQYTYTFKEWVDETDAVLTEETTVIGNVTYKAVYSATVNEYTITWQNEDGTELYSEELKYGETPVYGGETPVKNATAEFTYAFDKWTPEVVAVTGNATYKATYTAIRNSYTVNWVNDNGAPLDADTVPYGNIPTYDGLTPEKAADVQYTYTFAGWDKDIVAVTGDVTYTATYDKIVNKYKITWVVEGVETVKEFEYGTVPMYGETADVKPSKNNTAEYFYSFKGWTPAVIAVVGDATYTAVFDPIPVNYTITFNTDGGTAISPITIGFGLDVSDVSDPTKTGYTFIGWDKEIPETMPAENVTITALWQINQYTITFDSNGGSAVDPITQDYDSVVNAPVVPTRYGYDFNGWYLDGAKVEFPMNMPAEDLVFKAEWTVTTYTITWVDGDGNIIDTDTVNHGSTPSYVGNVPAKDTDAQYNYTFNGKWSPEIVPAVGNATYTAQFDKALREYRIGWDINGDGIEDVATYVSYGTVPTHTDGVKAPDEQYEYRFIGWSPELGAVTGVATYTAMFEPVPVEYTITLDPDGGEFADGSTEVMEITAGYGTAITEPENPTKTGYHFLYWMDTEGNESFVPDTMPVGGSILKAKWAVNSYTITFVTGDGATAVAPIIDYYGDLVIAPADPTREGYTFAGWDIAVPATMPAGDMVITAKWTVNQYTISFVDADGTPISSNTLDYNAEIGIVADPVKTGYDFTGWVDEFGTQAIIPANMPAQDLTYTATWTPKQFMVAYYADGELVSVEYVYCGSELVSPATEPTKTGYTFAGWVISGANEAMPETMPASNLILEASWSVGLYTLTYTDGVGNTIYTAQVEYGATITPPAAPTREGYTFRGWSNNRTTMPARNLTINAQWNVNVYTITFVDASGSVIDTVTKAYGQSVTAPAAPAKNGYTFAGWVPAVPATMPVNGAVITATYTANEYRIVFNTNGGSAVADIVALCDEPIVAPADPVRDGYIFVGWDAQIPATMPAGGLTLNAQWTPSRYAINWDTDGDGVVDDTTTVAVGDTPVHADGVKPATAEYTYVFAGWTPAISPVTGTVTYTATFTSVPNNYTLAFDTDGGSAVESLTVAYGSVIDLSAVAAPTKEGYTFIGWSTAPETMPAQNVTLVAQWKANEYTITFDTADGTAVAPITVEFGNRISKPVDPERVGYTFAGWSVDGITAVEFPETMPTGGLSLKALWTVKQYTITYVVDDNAEYAKYTIDFGAAVTQPEVPIKADYTFIGWSPAVPETMPALNITVTAQFRYSYTGWKTTASGTTYYVDGEMEYISAWQTIEDKDYYFDENGYVVKGMAQVPAKDGTRISKFIFDETTGAFAADYSGLYDHGADTYMAENGEIKNTEGLVRIVKPDGEVNYYYFVSGKAVKGTTASVEKTNGLLLPTNNYVFDEFGVILHDEDTSKNGKITEADGVTYYYVDGVKAYMGLVFDGEYYYYFNDDGVMVTDGKYEVIRTNDLLPADTYRFDKQGRLTFVLCGDLDDDGDVDKNDAIYCLYSVLFGEVRYPLNQDADFNGDGSLDKNDAIYLLYHALFGEARYPLD